MKKLKFKEGDGLIHHNNIAYIFRVVAVNQEHNFYTIVPQGNNYVETLNGNIMLVSADIIEKEFYPIEAHIEIEL